jgi:hypothetical protein
LERAEQREVSASYVLLFTPIKRSDGRNNGQRMSWVGFELRWSIEWGGLHTLLNQKIQRKRKGGNSFSAMQCSPATSNAIMPWKKVIDQ